MGAATGKRLKILTMERSIRGKEPAWAPRKTFLGNFYPWPCTLVIFSRPPRHMDFPSALKFKLRVAVVPYTAVQDMKRFLPGNKRDFSNVVAASPQIHRQFLILAPTDVRFSDLKPLLKAQYEKLYSHDSQYFPIRKVLKFRDEMQCDLDDDFLVAEICEAGSLLIAVCDFDFHNAKRVKPSEKAPVPAFKDLKHDQKPDPKHDFKKQKPVEVQKEDVKKSEVQTKKPVEQKRIEPQKEKVQEQAPVEVHNEEVQAPVEVKNETQVPVKVQNEEHEPNTTQTETDSEISAPVETEILPSVVPEATETATEVIQEAHSIPEVEAVEAASQKEKIAIDMEKVAKGIAKSISEDAKKKNEIVEQKMDETPETTAKAVRIKPTQSRLSKAKTIATVETTTFNQSPITPSPSPFIPRKQSEDSDSSSDDDQVVSEAINSVFGFELPSLVVTQPKRSEVSILFAAEDSEDETTTQEPPKSISPVPDPASIPSLQQVAESVSRTPTPNQISQQKKQRGRPKKMPTDEQ